MLVVKNVFQVQKAKPRGQNSWFIAANFVQDERSLLQKCD